MNITNLTPHNVIIGSEVIPASGIVARVQTRRRLQVGIIGAIPRLGRL